MFVFFKVIQGGGGVLFICFFPVFVLPNLLQIQCKKLLIDLIPLPLTFPLPGGIGDFYWQHQDWCNTRRWHEGPGLHDGTLVRVVGFNLVRQLVGQSFCDVMQDAAHHDLPLSGL